MKRVALSIKQPWVTLILLGIKRLEIRTWSTRQRGEVWLHAGKDAEKRIEPWNLVPDEGDELSQLRGGLIGKIEVVGCKAFTNVQDFTADEQLHRVPGSWFRPPRMYGFELMNPTIVDFYPCKGALFFFEI